MIYGCKSYNHYLNELFLEKVGKNPSYSLRAFASFLELAPSTLSEILSGKRQLSVKRAREISKKLQLGPGEGQYFTLMVELESCSNEREREDLKKIINHLNPKVKSDDVSLEVFKSIKQWYHLAILELSPIDNYELCATQVAKTLGLSEEMAQEALERLKKLNLLQWDPAKKKWVKSSSSIRIESADKNEALRAFHKEMLSKAIEAVDGQTNSEKFIGSETLLLSEDSIAEAEVILEECFQKIIKLSNDSKKSDHVYHCGIQLFKISKKILTNRRIQ